MAGGFQSGKIKGFTTTRLETKLTNRIQYIINNRADKAAAKIKSTVEGIVEENIESNRVVRSLLGNRANNTTGDDLQAEFGLTDGMASAGVEKLIEILKSTVKVKVVKQFSSNLRSAHVSIVISALNPKDYESQLLSDEEPFSYTSERHIEDSKAFKKYARKHGLSTTSEKHSIQWMKWLVEASQGIGTIESSIPDIGSYGITYNLTGKEGSVISRSGRAIMVGELQAKRVKNFPYQFPKIAKPNAGRKNFIEEVTKSAQFRNEVSKESKKALMSILKPRIR